jgi:hypothetical protein
MMVSCCELLPVEPENQQIYYLINPLTIANCVDEEKTEYCYNEREKRKSIIVEKYHFLPDRVPDVPLFLVQNHSGIFTATGVTAEQREFKAAVENAGLTGLDFKLLWTNEG